MITKFRLYENIDENDAEYYRGVSIEDAINWCKGNPTPSYDPMPLDFEVVEYGIGDAIDDMDEDDVENWVKSVCDWYDGSPKSVKNGLNVTTDFSNAEGYGECVLGLNSTGEVAEFSDSHVFIRNYKETELVFVYYEDEFYTPEEFLRLK